MSKLLGEKIMSVSNSEAAEPGLALDLGRSVVVVSRSGTEYHLAEPLDDWEALR